MGGGPGMSQQPAGRMPPQPGMGARMPAQPGMGQAMPMQQMTPAQKYQDAAAKLLPSVTARNPYLKEQVGQVIYEYVGLMVPEGRAPKITGMLIELPVEQIQQYMSSLDALQSKVREATDLIDAAEDATKSQL